MSNYCEIVLYVGRCLCDGLMPGRFYSENDDPYSLRRIADALRTIEKYLLPSQNWGLIIDYNNLVKDNIEADKLVEHAKRNFPNAREIIEPYVCIHGRIVFARKIRIDGCLEGDADDIVEVMKKSRHEPNEFTKKANWIKKTYESEAIRASELRELQEKEDDFWRGVLKFY
ncbi:MAG: hypothetical protein ACLPX5_04195 [Dissulfurispiraceae bacterium]